jgi:Na+-translocating ferredoxin:NAD+ oxidoreductase subunit B
MIAGRRIRRYHEENARMTDPIYEHLVDALNALPNGFPRTPSRVELRLLAKIVTPEEAALASQLRGDFEPVAEIAARVGLPQQDVTKRLIALVRRGLVWLSKQEGTLCFRLAPFIVGIYEEQLDRLDHELAHLVEAYMLDGGAAGIMGPQPALHRVMPAHHAVKTEAILPYDDVRALILAAKTFHVRDCICRAQQDYVGRHCDFPLDVCLSFSSSERPAAPGDLTQQEALALLDRCEELGLVHTVSNVTQGMSYICNCCGCCCGILRGITEWGIEHSVARANYCAVIDPDDCQGCGVCVERCQVHAIALKNEVAVVDSARCIGCGLCVTGCPHHVAQLEPLPEAEQVQPPSDYATWERERLHNRGLDGI